MYRAKSIPLSQRLIQSQYSGSPPAIFLQSIPNRSSGPISNRYSPYPIILRHSSAATHDGPISDLPYGLIGSHFEVSHRSRIQNPILRVPYSRIQCSTIVPSYICYLHGFPTLLLGLWGVSPCLKNSRLSLDSFLRFRFSQTI